MSPLRCHSRHRRAQTRQPAEAGGGPAAETVACPVSDATALIISNVITLR
jgi:hypothetical protein